jgi:CRISPR/Cas system-associated exonuclease Cas4 (RecB family)
MKVVTRILIVVVLTLATAVVFAQTSYEVKSGTVVSVFNDQLVVKMSNGEIKQYTIPAGFQFTVDGRQVGLADLTPGTALSATIKTTKTPEVVRTTSIRNGTVVRVVGNNLTIREANQTKTYVIPKGFQFDVDGKQVGVDKLRPGYKLTAEIVYKSENTVTTRDVDIGGNTPAPPPAAAPAAAASSEPAQMAEAAPAATELPKTASPLPLIGLLGTLLTASGFAVRRMSRR